MHSALISSPTYPALSSKIQKYIFQLLLSTKLSFRPSLSCFLPPRKFRLIPLSESPITCTIWLSVLSIRLITCIDSLNTSREKRLSRCMRRKNWTVQAIHNRCQFFSFDAISSVWNKYCILREFFFQQRDCMGR